ncbi:hypothetical protein [Arthrobacter globiformis]|uniref:hypothetical protein n=1 Tax=Arthrobacter globiformis TaxID=1665 RepID=UPI00167DB37C|nr:hypothetical protein [Arthrobacter globiformis]
MDRRREDPRRHRIDDFRPGAKNIRNEAIEAGIPATRIHYEVFGPDIWLAA